LRCDGRSLRAEYHDWTLVVASLRKALPNAILDCHLMIEHADEFIPAFCGSRCELDLRGTRKRAFIFNRTLQLIEAHGCKRAVVVNPATPVHTLDEVLDMVHHDSGDVA